MLLPKLLQLERQDQDGVPVSPADAGNDSIVRGSAIQTMEMKLIAEQTILLTGRACTMRRIVQIARSRCR